MSFENQFKDLLKLLAEIGDGISSSIKVFSDGAAILEDGEGTEITMIEDIFDYDEMEKAIGELEKCL